ncbi:MAG: PTS sugar transporter subunit IIB [Synergistaceae bacterium]|nr:PTS sugar transporter subunit IIB [Synergistaceae bacterium]
MIKLVRVDHRLVHGQVAFSWTKYLDADCILIANDALTRNELKRSAMKLATPSGVKLVMKSVDDSITALNSGVTDKYKLMILLESVEDAYRVTEKVKFIKSINLGGMKSAANRRQISKAVHVSDEDVTLLKKMRSEGVEFEIRLVPNDVEQDPMKLI